MSSFLFEKLQTGFPPNLISGNFLWIWNADKIPPHIGISAGSDYFSLTYREVEELQVSSMVRKVKRTLIPIVIIELDSNLSSKLINRIFSKYERAKVGGPTCLFPIREALGLQDSVQQLSELLSVLSRENAGFKSFGINLPENYNTLPSYSISEIMFRIEELASKK